jgi:hypothetical protein
MSGSAKRQCDRALPSLPPKSSTLCPASSYRAGVGFIVGKIYCTIYCTSQGAWRAVTCNVFLASQNCAGIRGHCPSPGTSRFSILTTASERPSRGKTSSAGRSCRHPPFRAAPRASAAFELSPSQTPDPPGRPASSAARGTGRPRTCRCRTCPWRRRLCRPRRSSTPRWSRTAAASLPGRKPPFWAVKRPARPYKIAIQNRFTMENAEGA